MTWGFPISWAGEESACNSGDPGTIPGSVRSPREGNSYPLLYFGLENSMACIVHGVAKSWNWLRDFWHPTPVLLPGKSHGQPGRLQSMGSLRVGHNWATSFSLFTFTHWRRNGNPLQCSCLENPRDGGACWAAVCGVAQSRTWLRWLSSSSNRDFHFNFLLMIGITNFEPQLNKLLYSPLLTKGLHFLISSLYYQNCTNYHYILNFANEICGNFLLLYMYLYVILILPLAC